MIKLTQKIYEVSEKTERKIQDMSSMYSEEVRKAESFGLEIPPVPTYKMKDEDYDVTEVVLLIDPLEIMAITSSPEGETLIYTRMGKEFVIKESVEEAYNEYSKI